MELLGGASIGLYVLQSPQDAVLVPGGDRQLRRVSEA